ncbi:hypothetical protein EG831_03185 [bacterium]|nr:hypothetical protein [bacterium]
MKYLSVLLVLAAIAASAATQPVALPIDDDPPPAPAWGANVTVTGQPVYAFDVDYRDNGEMYVGIVCPATARDTFKVLRSADGGLSWSPFQLYLANGGRKFTDIALICGEESLLVFVPQDTARGPSRDYAARFGYAGGVQWSNFTDTMQTPRGVIVNVDADRSAGGDTMMIAYAADSAGINTGSAIRRSINGGASWLWLLSNRSARHASIAWIKDQMWAVAYKCYWTDPYYYKHTFVYVSNDAGLNFEAARVDSTARDTLNSGPAITACRATGRAQVAVTYDNPATGGDIRVYRALDAGDTTYRLVLDYAPGDDQILPAINCLRLDSTGWIDLAYADDYGDCIGRLSSQYGDSGSWGAAQIVSDRPASVSIAPQIAYCNDGSHPGPAVFYAGSGGNGIYMNAGWITGVAGAPGAAATGPGLLLRPNRPNPFKQWTMIDYQLLAAGTVSLKVYNVAGQLVRTLAEGFQPAGAHAVRWDGRDDRGREIAAGVYVCRLDAGGISTAGRLVHIR